VPDSADNASRDPAYLGAFASRNLKAAGFCEQILEVTAPFLSKPVKEVEVLDVGSGEGHIAAELASRCRKVIGIEPSAFLFEKARALQRDRKIANLEFRRSGVEDLSDVEAYDLIVLDNVLEHIKDQRDALRRLTRALRSGGAIYILTPNKLWPIEVHYGLPFLSWLPLPLANRYLRWSGRGTNYEDASHAPTFGRLSDLLRGENLRFQFVVPPNLLNTLGGNSLHYRLGAALLRRLPFLWRISKGFLVVAHK
jgi:2-polyprenyl-3-methyl-5-hydroxy-6-metoxy-1,4-benzoquinol methylase